MARRMLRLALTLALTTGSLAAFWAPPAHAREKAENAYVLLAAQDRLLLSTGWRLTRANATSCRKTIPSIGMQLVDVYSFTHPDAARDALGLSGDIGIGALAAGGPAERAGMGAIHTITVIGDLKIRTLPAVEPGDYRRAAQLQDTLDKMLARDRIVTIRGRSAKGIPHTVTVTAEPTCASRLEVVTRGDSAYADGHRVLVSSKLMEEIGDSAFLPVAVAHELAHTLLSHPQGKAEAGGWAHTRHTEREADRLSIWLLANAGYDPALGPKFMREWIRRGDLGILVPTHDAWDERAAAMEEEIEIIKSMTERQASAADRHFDWSCRFPMSRAEAKPRQ